jgi:hypothetical protein
MTSDTGTTKSLYIWIFEERNRVLLLSSSSCFHFSVVHGKDLSIVSA